MRRHNCSLHVKTRNQLGEGIIWDCKTATLFWVDIPKRHVLRLSEQDNVPRTIEMPEEPGSLAMLADGDLLVAAGRSLYRVSPDGRRIERLDEAPDMAPRTGFNDGKADRAGRLIFGSKDDDVAAATGAMFELDAGLIRLLFEPLIAFNGPAFNRAGDRIYFANTPAGQIFAAAYDPATGDMGSPELFVQVPKADGWPDGMTVDAEDHLWNAHWDGGRLTRYRPDGSVERVMKLPVQRPTSLCFGGPDLQTIFVSSAAVTDKNDRSTDPAIADGDVLRRDLGMTGAPETRVI